MGEGVLFDHGDPIYCLGTVAANTFFELIDFIQTPAQVLPEDLVLWSFIPNLRPSAGWISIRF